MDLKAEKLSLIEWLAGVDDNRVIQQLKALREANLKQGSISLSRAEQLAIDQGLADISQGRIYSHDAVMEAAKLKFPKLFK